MALNDEAYLFDAAIYQVGGTLVQKLRLRLSKGEQGGVCGNGCVSRDLKRLLIVAETLKGGIGWLDIPPHVTAEWAFIYDIPSGRELGNTPFPVDNLFWSGGRGAISPNGEQFAILSNGLLLIADVSPADAEGTTGPPEK